MSKTAPDLDPAPDPAVERAEHRLALLRELSEIGMDLARGLRERALNEAEAPEEDDSPAPIRAARRDPAKAFASLSRAIRLTLSLEAKTDEALQDLLAGVTRRSEERTAQRRQARVANLRALMLDAANVEWPDEVQRERLDRDLDERLDLQEDFWGDPDRPLREVIEALCRSYGLSPDWSRWRGEGWDGDDGLPAWPYGWFHGGPQDDAETPPGETAPAGKACERSGASPAHALE